MEWEVKEESKKMAKNGPMPKFLIGSMSSQKPNDFFIR